MSRRPKIALVGAGNIGGELAAAAARKELGAWLNEMESDAASWATVKP